MSKNIEFENIAFDLPKNKSNVIKVIGVGGGGGNAINHMFEAGINGVDFVICNTDAQALQNSAVPNKIQLGVSLTEGLGAGANPEIGEQAALESMEEIKAMFGQATKMAFITAGMGGGTGTGAAPVIAKVAREMDILTVGIVTIPFLFEGAMRCKQAQKGIDTLRENVDSLIVVNNNKLREIFGNLGFKAGFSKADEVLATAARGIAEVITHHYTQNIDLRDAKTVLSNSGTAIMGSASATGSSRANEAIMKALDSPLLNDNKITGAKNVLLLIVSGSQEITIDEIGEINDHIQMEAGHSANIIMGVGEDESLGEAIAVTVIATGFNIDQQDDIVNTESKKIIHTLEDEQRAVQNLNSDAAVQAVPQPKTEPETPAPEMKTVKYTLEEEEEAEPEIQIQKQEIKEEESQKHSDLIETTEIIKNLNVVFEEVVPETVAENIDEDFIIIEAKNVLNDIEVIDPEIVSVKNEQEDQFSLSFDIPLRNEEEEEKENTVVFDLTTDEINNIEVKGAEEVEPSEIYELVEEGDEDQEDEKEEVRYDLEQYMELESRLNEAEPATKKKQVSVTEEELVFEKKVVDPETAASQQGGAPANDQNPYDNSIDDVLRKRVDSRRSQLKKFNHNFNNSNNIDDFEKIPAYKRQGVNINEAPREQKLSRTSLSEDSNEEIQLRSNNSFLHDNVD